MKVKECLGELFADVKAFDTSFYKKLVFSNIGFITRSSEHRNLFGNKVIGCYFLSYTMYDKDIFYDNLFGMDYNSVSDQLEKISTIPKAFKTARDDVNLVCFYIAHRFLSNPELSKEKAVEYAKEALNYFNYRTLVLLSSKYFVYPISDERAQSLMERLSNKYLIKKLKNWNEYCNYRSSEFLDNKFLPALTKFTDDTEITKAIADLVGRTNDALKNIAGEFQDLMESDNVIKTTKNVINDVEGNEVLADRIETPEAYITRLEATLSDSSVFVKKDIVETTVSLVNSVSYKQLEECLILVSDYSFTGRNEHIEITTFLKDVITDAIAYLTKNNIALHTRTDLVAAVNEILGNVLYARGTDITINKIKDHGDKLIKKVYKAKKQSITDRNVKNLRNALYLYVVLRCLFN